MADKQRCLKCGAENYATDSLCLSCGASLREEQPSPSPRASSPPTAGAAPGPAAEGAAGAQSAKAVAPAPPQAAAGALAPWLRVLATSLVLTLLEMIIVSAISHGQHPSRVWGVHLAGGAVGRVALATVMCGLGRAALVGGLLYLTGWSPSVGVLAGGALGFALLGTIWGGAVVGFGIGLALGGHRHMPKD